MDIFKVSIEKDKVVVEGNLLPHDPRHTPRQKVGSGEAREYLTSSGIEFGKCINENESLDNTKSNKLSATWIFEKKTKKSLDKPAEKVILSKENKPAPKKRKSRAKKKTSK